MSRSRSTPLARTSGGGTTPGLLLLLDTKPSQPVYCLSYSSAVVPPMRHLLLALAKSQTHPHPPRHRGRHPLTLVSTGPQTESSISLPASLAAHTLAFCTAAQPPPTTSTCLSLPAAQAQSSPAK